MTTQTDRFDVRPDGEEAGDHRDPRDRATDVAHDASGEARSVAHTAQQEASRVGDEVRDQVTNLTSTAREQLHEQARHQADQVGAAIGGMGERIQALADGRPEDAGQAQEVVRSVAVQLHHLSDRVDQLGFDGAVDELQRYARRRPGAFLAGAAALGFAAARLMHGARSADDDRATSGRANPSRAQQPSTPSPRSHPRDTSQPASYGVEEDRAPLDGPIVVPDLAGERKRP